MVPNVVTIGRRSKSLYQTSSSVVTDSSSDSGVEGESRKKKIRVHPFQSLPLSLPVLFFHITAVANLIMAFQDSLDVEISRITRPNDRSAPRVLVSASLSRDHASQYRRVCSASSMYPLSQCSQMFVSLFWIRYK